ncbi:MAG: DUF1788 domain-containing protein [Thermoguttaceae bacterium]|nr:DUF1788 domain-containing protein [Thermoguttaceae bacterium]
MTDQKEIDFSNRLLALFDKIQKPSFNKIRPGGNETRYYIFDYPPEYERICREILAEKTARNNANKGTAPIVVLDLYDLVIDILEERRYLDRCFQLEKTRGFETISKALDGVLRVESPQGALIQKIRERVQPESIVFITGVGKCYPMLRSHKVLNNLHLAFSGNPVIMFYPGRYSGQELALFGMISDGNYYRALRFV